MACNIYKFNENNLNLVSSQKQNLKYNTTLNTSGNHFYYGLVYNDTNSNWTCIYNSTQELINIGFIEKRDFKILIRSNRVYLFLGIIKDYYDETPTTIDVYNCYFNSPNFVNGQYYEIEVIIDYLSSFQNHKVKINDITYNISGFENSWGGVPATNIQLWTDFYILTKIDNNCWIGDSFQYYQYYQLFMDNDYLYNGLVNNVGNWAICYHIRGYYDTDDANSFFNKVFQAIFKGTPDYQAEFALYGVNFQLIHNTSFLYDTEEVSEELFCCDDCKHKYLTTINLDNIQLGTKSKINSFSIGTVENINITNTETISCTNDWNILNPFIFPISIYLYSNFNIKDYFILFNTTDECFDIYISVNICNAKLQLQGENIGFDLSYTDNTECCEDIVREIIISDRDAEYSCCLESYYINKDFLFYQKYYLSNVKETRKQFYNYLSNVNPLFSKYYYIWHRYYSIYYIRELENRYCYSTYNIKNYVNEKDCRYIDIKCLSENMSSIKNCCEDIEFDLLCKCKDEYPMNLAIKVINIDIKSFTSITLTNEINSEIGKYNCCEEGLGVELIAIERDLNIASITYTFNNTTGEFTNFIISGLTPSVNVPITEYIDIKLRYCNKYDIIKRIEINYYSSCTENKIDIIDKDVFKEHELEYGKKLNNEKLDIKIISIVDSANICCSNLVNQGKTFYPITDITYEIESNPIIKINSIVYTTASSNHILRIDYDIVASYIDLSKLKKISPCKYLYEKIVKIKFKMCNQYYEVFANIKVVINRDESLYEIKFLQAYNSLNTSNIPVINNDTPPLNLVNVINIQNEECCDGTCTSSLKFKQIKILYFNSSNQIITASTEIYDLNDGTVYSIDTHDIDITYLVEHNNVVLDKYSCGVQYMIILSKTNFPLLTFPSGAVRAELYLTYESDICGKIVNGTRKILIVNL